MPSKSREQTKRGDNFYIFLLPGPFRIFRIEHYVYVPIDIIEISIVLSLKFWCDGTLTDLKGQIIAKRLNSLDFHSLAHKKALRIFHMYLAVETSK